MTAISNRTKNKAIPTLHLDWGGHGDAAAAPRRPVLWATEVFQDIENVVGKQRAKMYLDAYLTRLDAIAGKLAVGAMMAPSIKETAHDVSSMSGQLGFEALSTMSTWMMVEPDSASINSNAKAWLNVIEASSDAARLYMHKNLVGLC